jgi:hypothetical protein
MNKYLKNFNFYLRFSKRLMVYEYTNDESLDWSSDYEKHSEKQAANVREHVHGDYLFPLMCVGWPTLDRTVFAIHDKYSSTKTIILSTISHSEDRISTYAIKFAFDKKGICTLAKINNN